MWLPPNLGPRKTFGWYSDATSLYNVLKMTLPRRENNPPFESHQAAKKQIPKWVSAFLVREMGLEPTRR